MSAFYITTAIEYANGEPHLGHAFEKIGADAIARYRSLERELEESLEYLTTCRECSPPRTTQDDCPHCPVDHGMKTEPALVAGFHTTPPGTGIHIPLVSEDA